MVGCVVGPDQLPPALTTVEVGPLGLNASPALGLQGGSPPSTEADTDE